MAKPIKNKGAAKNIVSKNIKRPSVAVPKEQFWGLEKFLEKNQTAVILIFLIVSLIFSFFLFDARISEGGDDSGYIERAWELLKNNTWPFYQGPVYPLVLVIPIYFFGMNLILLKLTSVIFALGTIWFTYLAFRKRIPYLVLFSVIFFLAVNSVIQYFASQTYTETFFLFFQAFVLYLVFKLIDSIMVEGNTINEKVKYKQVLWIGFWIVLLSLSKEIAIISIVPVVLFFLFYRKYKYGIFILISFVVWKVLVEALIRTFYKGSSGHLQQMLLVNYYKPELGYETVSGLIGRFFSNVDNFLSVSVLKICHFRGEFVSFQPIVILAIVIAAALIAIVIRSYKRNRYIFFTVTYVIILFCGVCFALSVPLAQDRHILLIIPLIYLVLIYGLYQLTIKTSVLRFYFFCFLLVFLAINLFNSIEASTKNLKALQKNIKGDIYYGFTEDWVNYLRLSAYCADSLPPSSFVASRKAPMSFIYGKGKEFYPVWAVFSNNPDTILAKFKQEKVTHIILASLRQNPRVNNGQIINTMQRLASSVAQKYPTKLTLVKQIGESEPAYLYKFNY